MPSFLTPEDIRLASEAEEGGDAGPFIRRMKEVPLFYSPICRGAVQYGLKKGDRWVARPYGEITAVLGIRPSFMERFLGELKG